MQPRIEKIGEKKLVGIYLRMSVLKNRTEELWKRFMPRKKEILYKVTAEMISMQVYEADYFKGFNPDNEFEKWATVEVANFDSVPSDMATYVLPGGLYAVFDYKGSSADISVFQYIFSTWLPNSSYDLDDRPHYEVLGEKYRNNNSNSEEEIWIPIKEK